VIAEVFYMRVTRVRQAALLNRMGHFNWSFMDWLIRYIGFRYLIGEGGCLNIIDVSVLCLFTCLTHLLNDN
jgi:hypothetical protein